MKAGLSSIAFVASAMAYPYASDLMLACKEARRGESRDQCKGAGTTGLSAEV